MAKPLGTVLIERLEQAGCDKRGQYQLAASIVAIVNAEVHSYLKSGTGKAAWGVVDALEVAADELRKHGEGLGEK